MYDFLTMLFYEFIKIYTAGAIIVFCFSLLLIFFGPGDQLIWENGKKATPLELVTFALFYGLLWVLMAPSFLRGLFSKK